MKQLYYRYLAFIYALTHRTNHRRFLGFAISSWIKLLVLGLMLVVWIRKWDGVPLSAALLAAGWVFLTYWIGRRAGYVKFIADPTAHPAPPEPVPLPANERVKLWATGVFIVRDDGDYALLRPAEYWRVPLGDHIVMVKFAAERFAYQFFNATGLLEIRPGCLLFGSLLPHTLEVTVLETHQAIEPAQYNFADPDKLDETTSKKRVLYFTFANEEALLSVWQNMAHDAGRVRS